MQRGNEVSIIVDGCLPCLLPSPVFVLKTLTLLLGIRQFVKTIGELNTIDEGFKAQCHAARRLAQHGALEVPRHALSSVGPSAQLMISGMNSARMTP